MNKDMRHLDQIIEAFKQADDSTRELLRDSSMEELRYIFQDCSIEFLKEGLARFSQLEEYEWCNKMKTLIAEKEQKNRTLTNSALSYQRSTAGTLRQK